MIRLPDVLATRNDLAPPPLDLLDGAALFLDFDGTLVELAPRPDLVHVDRELAALMARLIRRLDGRVAVISGRPAGEISRLFGAPSFAIAGSHGMEVHHADGRRSVAERPAALNAIGEAFHAHAADRPGVIVEPKPLGVALHYRAAPEHGAGATALARRLADAHDLRLQTGKMMVEVRAGAGDKGDALAALMREPGMATGRPLFMGDDDTDEPAFARAAALGGGGILVGAPRVSAARFRLEDVAAVRAWLGEAAR